MYLLTLKKWQLNTTIKGQASLMVSGQHSSIQVHQCVPPEILYTGSPVCSTRGPLYRFTNVFHQRSSIQVHQCVPPEVLYAGSPVCSTRGPLQVHQCVPSEVLYPGSPVCSTRDPLYRFTSVFHQRSAIQVHQCVPLVPCVKWKKRTISR